MKNRFHLIRILMILPLLCACHFLIAQTNSKQDYRWQKKSRYQVSSSEAGSYAKLPEVDYAPENIVETCSKSEELKAFAAKQGSKRITVRTILKIDEEGVIRSVRILNTNNAAAADALSKLLTNAKASGPAYVHNKAVTAFVPCFFSITDNKILSL